MAPLTRVRPPEIANGGVLAASGASTPYHKPEVELGTHWNIPVPPKLPFKATSQAGLVSSHTKARLRSKSAQIREMGSSDFAAPPLYHFLRPAEGTHNVSMRGGSEQTDREDRGQLE